MNQDDMKRGTGLILVLSLSLIVISLLAQYSGAASYGGSYPGASYFPTRNLGDTTIDIIPSYIDEKGNAIVEAGKQIYFKINVGKNGIRGDSVELHNKVSGLRVDAISDICKRGFCTDDNENLCLPGPKCFEDREGSFKISLSRKPGTYIITACPGNIPTNSCKGNEIASPAFQVVKPSAKTTTSTFFQGQTLISPFIS